MKSVMIVGSAEQSGGGVAAVLKLYKKMPVWEEYSCYWLGTQIQANKWTKLWYAVKAYFMAFFMMWRYDIVHFHTVPDVSMKVQLPVFLLALLWRKKIVVHLHVCKQLEMKEYINYKLAHWCMNKADRIVLLAYTAEQLLRKHWQDIKIPTTVIYNPCEKVDAIPYKAHDKTILYAGRFTDNKCGWLLIKAFNLIHQKYPDWKLQLLGDGEEKPIYLDLIKEYGLEDKVEMPGFQYGENLACYYRKAGIYGMTSHYEGMPMVVIDAWNYGVPVVSTPVGGLIELLEENKTGCVYDFDEFEGLAMKLDHLMGDSELRQNMSDYCKNIAIEKFSMEKINKDLTNLYSTL